MAKRIATAVVIVAAMVLMLVMYLPGMRPQPQAPGGTVSGSVAIGGPFTLTDTKGNTVTEAALNGRLSLVFFGFTHCPDICPLTLQLITQALELTGPAAETVLPVFITVDPERDTLEAMASYAANFHPRLLALTGTPEQVRLATQSYRVYAAKSPVKDAAGKETGDYTVNHTGYTYLMDRNGKYVTHFSREATAEDIAARLRQELARP